MMMTSDKPVLFLVIYLLPLLSAISCAAAPAPTRFSSPRFPSSLRRFKPYATRAAAAAAEEWSGMYETRYFTQTLDHFGYRPESYATFQQRYLVNTTYWGGAASAAPIFVYTGNEGDITWFASNTGFMFEAAPIFGALLMFVEHRFYGESIPFGGKDQAYNNASTLGYLTSTQAIADYVTLILDFKKNMSADRSPVIVFGGSYGGMLAAWLRLKYPHIAIGALASSAPILQFDNITSPYSFINIITNDFRSESESCYRVIKNTWKELEDSFYLNGGAEKLRQELRICNGTTIDFGLEGWIQNALIYAAMTDYPTTSNFITPLPANPVKQMCKAIDNPTTGNDTFARLYGAMNIYYNYTGELSCFDLYDSDPHGMAEWSWQACTEMVMQTGGSDEVSIFPKWVDNYTELATNCKEYYGVEPRPHWITTEFGGHDIKLVLKKFGSNIIFFNGLRDPWSGGGVLESLSGSLLAIVAPEGAHHVDLRFSTKEDPKWLQKIRRKELHIIAKWLREYYNDYDIVHNL